MFVCFVALRPKSTAMVNHSLCESSSIQWKFKNDSCKCQLDQFRINIQEFSEVGACWIWGKSILTIKIGKIWCSLKELNHIFMQIFMHL